MSIDTLLVVLLVWTVAGLLAAIAFGKAVQEISPDEEESLATSAGTIQYIHRNNDDVRDASVNVSGSRRGAKRASG
jgi:hypothetical protein